MKEMLASSMFFGLCISLLAYQAGLYLKRRLGWAILNPLMVSIVLTIGALLALGIDYPTYNQSGKYLSYLLTPTTICLAVPLYKQLGLLKKHLAAVLCGIASGVLTSLVSVYMLALVFQLDHAQYATLLPKSITTAIGMGVSQDYGGIVTITVAVIIITGVVGNVLAPLVLKTAGITEPVAKGIAIGTSAHAIGTTRAMELGEIEGAMSSLAIAVAGLITVAAASVFAGLI